MRRRRPGDTRFGAPNVRTRVTPTPLLDSLILDCELAPRDLSARFSRRTPGVGARAARRHRGRRALFLAALAVPAIAAAQDFTVSWAAFGLERAVGGEAPALEPMPFEQAGQSFPGSAFYYLSAEDPPAPLAADAHWDNEDGGASDGAIGPAARGLRVMGSEIDRMRALTCLTQAIYFEAASEPDAGQRAVAQVVLNRVAHPAFPKTVCGVVYQGSEKPTGCQFTFTCDGALARVPNRLFWDRAMSVARAALAGYVYAPVGLATHYHTAAIHPYWADSLNFLGQIGAHRFYRLGGPAGAAAEFNPAAYRGGEPMAAPLPRTAAPTDNAVVDPIAIEKAYAQGFKAAAFAPGGASAAAPSPAPSYSAPLEARGGDALYRANGLPGSGAVKPEYAQSGQWIVKP
jgi:hypothetical protein